MIMTKKQTEKKAVCFLFITRKSIKLQLVTKKCQNGLTFETLYARIAAYVAKRASKNPLFSKEKLK